MRLPSTCSLSVRPLITVMLIGVLGVWGCGPTAMPNYPAPPADPWFQKQVVDHKQPVLVVFGAVWCGYCKQMKPDLAQLGELYPDTLKVVELDVDERSAVADHYGYSALPRLMLFSEGKVIADEVGGRPLYALREFVSPHLPATK